MVSDIDDAFAMFVAYWAPFDIDIIICQWVPLVLYYHMQCSDARLSKCLCALATVVGGVTGWFGFLDMIMFVCIPCIHFVAQLSSILDCSVVDVYFYMCPGWWDAFVKVISAILIIYDRPQCGDISDDYV